MIDYYFIPVILIVVAVMCLIGYFKDDKIFFIMAGFILLVFGVYIAINGVDYEDSDLEDFPPQYIFSHTDVTIPVAGASIWTNVSFGQEDADVKSGISHSYLGILNDTFIIMEDGIYNMDYDFDVEDVSGASSDIDVAGRLILVNGTEVPGSVFETDIQKKGVETELSHNFLVSCRAGDKLKFQFVATGANVRISTHGTFGDHPESASVLMMKIANLPGITPTVIDGFLLKAIWIIFLGLGAYLVIWYSIKAIQEGF